MAGVFHPVAAKYDQTNDLMSMAISQKRFPLGMDSQVDLIGTESTYQSAQADLASYKTQIAQDINALNLLAGQQQPADLLAAEHDLKAANANSVWARPRSSLA
ncbi:TolC family protein [Gallaecimonas xiamenensis]|uniref:TolC family protein n=1 Tax=Gallaecimonas xiamenensis TaxID=1207039 RepID=UPI00178C7F63|nr:TolC family protein [Gallaecimonas xiamenensis]